MPQERAVSSSAPAPFKPPSAGATSFVVEASGTAKPGDIVSTSDKNATVSRKKSWEAPSYKATGADVTYFSYFEGGSQLQWKACVVSWTSCRLRRFGSKMNHNSGHGSGASGYSHGGGGGLYGGGMYSNNRYRGGNGGMYGSSGMYGGGMSSGDIGGSVGGYGPGGGPHGPQAPNNPNNGNPPSRPRFWISFLRGMQRVVRLFRRLSVIFDQYAQAFHLFMTGLLQAKVMLVLVVSKSPEINSSQTPKEETATGELEPETSPMWYTSPYHWGNTPMAYEYSLMLYGYLASFQVFDCSGLLYGELARFVLWLLGIKIRSRRINPSPPGRNGLPPNSSVNENYVAGREEAAPSGSWDNIWEYNANN
ncbi:hypothetical protein RIF29_32199 [Crotalaria pallida]|uniref:Peroxin-13 n=1 Tax=Crotalaria pallida TaxID=3830 RepID=A0AAN9HXZ7_CROPI